MTANQNGCIAIESHFKDLTGDIIGDVAFGYKFGNLEATTLPERQQALRTFMESGEVNVKVLVLLRPLFPLLMRLPFGRAKKREKINRLVHELMTEVNECC